MLKMKINMAEGDYFTIGMIVSCSTCHGQVLSGEVMSYDHASKLLAIKKACGKGTHDVSLINLNHVQHITVDKEAPSHPPTPINSLNLPKLAKRIKTNIEEKKRQVNYIGIGVSPLAQNLFHAITKTITDVRWAGENIIVLDHVTITPPYQTENCTCSKDHTLQLQHVQKIVEKYHRDAASDRSSIESAASSS